MRFSINFSSCLIGCLVASVLLGNAVWSSPVQKYNVELKSLNETFSFEIAGQKDWNYDLKRIKNKSGDKIVLKMSQVDSKKLNIINMAKNKFVKSINVKKASDQEMTEIEFNLDNDQVQTFDYLTDFPSKLIVDFYNSETADSEDKKVTTTTSSKKSAKNSTLKSQRNVKVSNIDKNRTPANTDFFLIDDDKKININEGFFSKSADQFERFSLETHELSAKIDPIQVDHFVKYPLLEQPLSFWDKMKVNKPNYIIEKRNTDETAKAQLIQRLYNKKRYLVIQQTADWFEKKYPQSKYLDIIYGMVADLHFEGWLQDNNDTNSFDIAQSYYTKLLKQTPDSVLAERTSLVSGMMDFQNKRYLVALRKLNAHSEKSKYRGKTSAVYAQMASSLAYAKLGKQVESSKVIDALTHLNIPENLKAEILYQKADIDFVNGQYQKAIEGYNRTEKQYPQYSLQFPNAVFNKMEASFQIKDVLMAHQSGIDFVRKFPTHEFAPYALTRVGEIIEVLGESQQKAIGAYLETHFKFGDNPKTVIARLHLVGARMKSMKDLELKQSIEKMNDLASKSGLENIQQFKTMIMSEGFVKRKEYNQAIHLLSVQLQNSADKKNNDQITTRIKNYIQEYIKDLSVNNKPIEVLKVYKKYSDNWLRKQESSESYYHIGKAYQDMGVYDVALKNYELSEKKNYSKTVPQNLYLNQAISFFENKDFQKSEVQLNKITHPEIMTSEEQINRVQLAAKIYEKKEDYATGVRYLSELLRVWSKEPELVVQPAIQTAELLAKMDQTGKGLQKLDDVLGMKISDASKVTILKTQAKLSMDKKMNPQAIKSLDALLKLSPSSNSQSLYQLGQLHYEQGDFKKAEITWNKLNENEEPFWNKLAQEKMKSDQWQKNYKKYVDRLPAATGVK